MSRDTSGRHNVEEESYQRPLFRRRTQKRTVRSRPSPDNVRAALRPRSSFARSKDNSTQVSGPHARLAILVRSVDVCWTRTTGKLELFRRVLQTEMHEREDWHGVRNTFGLSYQTDGLSQLFESMQYTMQVRRCFNQILLDHSRRDSKVARNLNHAHLILPSHEKNGSASGCEPVQG